VSPGRASISFISDPATSQAHWKFETNGCTVQFDEIGQIDQKDDLPVSEFYATHERKTLPLPAPGSLEQGSDPSLGDSRFPRGGSKLNLPRSEQASWIDLKGAGQSLRAAYSSCLPPRPS
jgi:hypothetical protein